MPHNARMHDSKANMKKKLQSLSNTQWGFFLYNFIGFFFFCLAYVKKAFQASV